MYDLGFDKISAYLGVLFLSARADYDVYQEKFYDEVYVTKAKKIAKNEDIQVGTK